MRKPKVRSSASSASSKASTAEPSTKSSAAGPGGPNNFNGSHDASPTIQPLTRATPADLAEKVKELIRLAKEQGYLTYNDINDALPDNVVSPDEMDDIYIKLRNLEIEIVDQAEVDRVKQPEPEEEEEKSRLDIL